MFNERPDITKTRTLLRFQNENFSTKEYIFKYPNVRTIGCDLLIIVKSSKGGKSVAIPVDKKFMMGAIPYFKGQYDANSNWRESKNTDEILISEVPGLIDADSVYLYVKSLYDDSFDPLTKKTCLGICQLSNYWCDDFMMKESVLFIEENMDSKMIMQFYDNFDLRVILKDIFRLYIEKQEEACCDSCTIMSGHEFTDIHKASNSLKIKCTQHSP